MHTIVHAVSSRVWPSLCLHVHSMRNNSEPDNSVSVVVMKLSECGGSRYCSRQDEGQIMMITERVMNTGRRINPNLI